MAGGKATTRTKKKPPAKPAAKARRSPAANPATRARPKTKPAARPGRAAPAKTPAKRPAAAKASAGADFGPPPAAGRPDRHRTSTLRSPSIATRSASKFIARFDPPGLAFFNLGGGCACCFRRLLRGRRSISMSTTWRRRSRRCASAASSSCNRRTCPAGRSRRLRQEGRRGMDGLLPRSRRQPAGAGRAALAAPSPSLLERGLGEAPELARMEALHAAWRAASPWRECRSRDAGRPGGDRSPRPCRAASVRHASGLSETQSSVP